MTSALWTPKKKEQPAVTPYFPIHLERSVEEEYTATCPGCNEDATWKTKRIEWSDRSHDYPPRIVIDCPRCGVSELVFPERVLTESEVKRGVVLIG